MSEMVNFALNYAAIGWYVYPCVSGTKKPLIEDNLNEASTDPKKIRTWWSKWPDANIGVSAGKSELVVIDEDEKNGKHGIEEFQKYTSGLYLFFGPTCTSRTPTGGRHRIFRSTKHKGISQQTDWLPGVDIRAGASGFLVPPSIINGVRYQWELDPGECEPLSEDEDEAVETLLEILEAFQNEGNGSGTGRELIEASRNENGKIPHGLRHSYVVSRCGEIASLMAKNTSAEAMLELVATDYEENCEDPYDDETISQFRRKYLKTLKKFISRKANEPPQDWSYNMAAWKAEHPGSEFVASKKAWNEVRLAGERAREAGKTFEQKPRDPPEVTGGQHDPEFRYDVVTVRGEERKKIQQSITNCIEAITFDPELYGKIRYNEMSLVAYICGQLPWMLDDHPREWTNADDSYLRQWLERYGLTNRDKITDAFDIVAHNNRFNPVHDELIDIRLNHWDGKTGHIRRLLPDYLGAEDSGYTYECMKLVMIAAIKRIFQPGCKFDLMMILVGPQGIGKSQFTKTLALYPEWYCDNFNSFEPDKAVAMLRGLWIVEVAELLAAKRAREIESIKAFITSTADVYREPYSRRSENRPRRCVFIGTTNDEQFLTDKTGNRRFLPIATGKHKPNKSLFSDRKAVYQDFFNAWGEALDIYLQDPEVELILPEQAAAEAEQQQDRYLADDVRIGMIIKYLEDRTTKGMTAPVCVNELYQKALNQIDRYPSRHESNELHMIMSDLPGWKRLPKRIRCGQYGPQWAYEKAIESVPNNDVPLEQIEFEDLNDLVENPFHDVE